MHRTRSASARTARVRRRPDCRLILRFSVLSGVGRVGSCLYALGYTCRRAASLPRPFMPCGYLYPAGIRADPDKTCDARRGKREKSDVTA
jgi:hypothetical protein